MVKKKSQIVLIIGLIVLLVGAIMSFTPWKDYANYVLVAGLLIIVVRGSLRIREKEGEQNNDSMTK